MKKILLIEDRTKRQQLFIKETEIDISKYTDIVDNAIDDFYYDIALKLKDDSFVFEKYSMIISHKSAFEDANTSIIEKLKNGCKKAKIPLVFFSGGIDENYYKKSDYELILMNSKVFYSKNLELFLDAYKDGNENILMLLYGKRWKLNIALNVLEQISYFLQINNDKEFYEDEVEENLDIHLLETIDFSYDLEIKDDEIIRKEIIKLKKSIYSYIQESIIYE